MNQPLIPHHNVQKHTEYTLDDLKSFINVTVAFIDSELTYTEAQKLISNPKQRIPNHIQSSAYAALHLSQPENAR